MELASVRVVTKTASAVVPTKPATIRLEPCKVAPTATSIKAKNTLWLRMLRNSESFACENPGATWGKCLRTSHQITIRIDTKARACAPATTTRRGQKRRATAVRVTDKALAAFVTHWVLARFPVVA